jgi:serine/threonine protein kinase
MLPVMGGLQKVHEAGFIHRDIKPANIFLRREQSPVLLDFGSARQALGEETKTLTSLVSPGYAPYEQYYSSSSEQGPWTDIYGLAATMYRAIVGRAPLDAVDRSKAILNTNRDTFVLVQELAKGRYSERFLKAVDHGLNFKREDRPLTIGDWRREFEVPTHAPVPSEAVTVEAGRESMISRMVPNAAKFTWPSVKLPAVAPLAQPEVDKAAQISQTPQPATATPTLNRPGNTGDWFV